MPIQTAIDSINNNQGSPFGFKNRIINGAMAISQGAAAATITPATSSAYATNFPVDRFEVIVGAASKLTTAQSTTTATGFSFSTLITSSSAYTAGASEVFAIRHKIEGFNTSDLMCGTANAQTITLSFQVRSSLTGTFGGSIQNSAANRSFPFTYTINAANTFEYKTITIPGDTSGTWIGATNGIGLIVNFGLGVGATFSGPANAWAGADYRSATGATSVVATNTATFFVTGVQVEKSRTATSFDYRPIGTELQLCQRYFWKIGGTAAYEQIAMGLVQATTSVNCLTLMPVAMRAAPSVGYSSASAFNINDGSVQVATTAVAIEQPALQTTGFTVTVASGLTLGRAARFFINNSTSAYINFSSEL